MHITLDQINGGRTKVFKTVAAAEALVAQISEPDDDLSYKVLPNPNGSGTATILVYDEDDNQIGTI